MDRFLCSLSIMTVWQSAWMPKIPSKLVKTLEISKKEPKRGIPGPRRLLRVPAWGEAEAQQQLLWGFRCPTPLDESMPIDPDPPLSAPGKKPWLAGCAVYTPPSSQTLSTTVWPEGSPVQVLLVSGSMITLAWPSTLPKPAKKCGTVSVTCVHRYK